MQYALIAVVIAGFMVVLGRIWLIRYRVGPLRREIRAQDVTFWVGLDTARMRDSGGLSRWTSLNAPMALYVRGDALEISSTFTPFRVTMGLEYYFKANETSIKMNQSPSRCGPGGAG